MGAGKVPDKSHPKSQADVVDEVVKYRTINDPPSNKPKPEPVMHYHPTPLEELKSRPKWEEHTTHDGRKWTSAYDVNGPCGSGSIHRGNLTHELHKVTCRKCLYSMANATEKGRMFMKRGGAMDFNISKAALPALWQADPAFREIAKYLYGDDVTLETIQKDLFGKYDNPNKNISRALHHPGPDGGALCGAKNATKIAKVGQEVNCPNCVFRAARSLSVVKMDPGPSDVHAQEPLKVGRKKKPMTIRPQDDEVQKNLEVIGKSFINLVEKAYEAGLIDDDGNLDMVEIEKSRTYVRDHAGKFASQGKHTGKMVAGIAAAGALAGAGAALGARSPKALKYAGESMKFVTHHLRSKDPIERHVARSLLPHALKASGKAVGQAGLGATASAGAVYEGTKTYNNFRHGVPGTKAARLEDVSKLPGQGLALRAGAEYVSRGTRLGERLTGYGPKHAAQVTRLKRLRSAAGSKVKDAALDPTAPATAMREILKPPGDITKSRTYNRNERGQFAAGATLAGAGAGIAAAAADKADDATHQSRRWQSVQGDAMMRREFNEPMPDSAERAHFGMHPSAANWGQHAVQAEHQAQTWAGNAKKLKRLSRGGAAGAAVGAAIVGEGLYHHYKEEAKKSADEHDVVWEGDFSKVDEDKQQVFGWASVTELDGKPVVDLQGDYIHPDDIEMAAYDYVLKSRVGGDMHTRVDEYGNIIEKSDKALHVSDLIESMVFTPEKCEAMGISKNLAGRWWTGFQINDPDIWQSVKNGERTGFSIHGAGLRKSIDIEELDPEAELIGKAYQESENMSQFIDNLATLEDVTGNQGFGDLAKHLAHGITAPQINPQQGRNAGVYGSMGSGVGGLAGGAIGAKFGHVGEGAGIGATVGGLTGTAFGVHHGKAQRPQRPPSLQGMGMKAASYVEKAVDNTNRMGGSVGVRQNMYQQQALQEATQMLAPQVAQHIQAMQEQRWQQQMMEQQMLAQQAQQQPQNFAVQMGPYANHQGGGQSGNSNPLAPSQQPQTPGSEPSMPQMPQTFSV